MSDLKKKYDSSKNEIVLALWKTRNGHYKTMPLDERSMQKLMNIKAGDTLLVRNRTEQAIANSTNPDTTPTAYLEKVPADEKAGQGSSSGY